MRDGNIFHISGVRNYIASLSYVTGSQSLKVGMQYQDGISRQSDLFRGDIDQIRWNGGLPRSVILRASPRYAVENIRDLGIYVDERWTFNRVTLSGGVRYDYFNGYAPEQYSEAGTWVAGASDAEGREHPELARHQSAPRRGVGSVRQRARRP